MVGIVKKIDGDGFGIIACANGSKILFIRADITNRNRLEPGETKHAPKEIGTLASRTRRGEQWSCFGGGWTRDCVERRRTILV